MKVVARVAVGVATVTELDVAQQQPVVVEHVVLFLDRFEGKSVGEAVQQLSLIHI